VHHLLHGRTDVQLDAWGLRQAHAVAERLTSEPPIDMLVSSPLSRALTTARIIGERIGLEPVVVPDLVEIDFGALEGATIERIVEEHPELARQMLEADGLDVVWPNGESRQGFFARVLAAFLAILAEHAHRRVVVVAHGGVIGSFVAQIHGLPPTDPSAFDIANCSLTHLHVTPDHTLVHLRNDVLHLELLGEPEDDAEGGRTE
jgi:2,3-bisphosphoglycerate-dependent phosphoglycerate mutase